MKSFKGNKESTKGRFKDTFQGTLRVQTSKHNRFHKNSTCHRGQPWCGERMRILFRICTPPHEQISLLTRRPVGWSRRWTKIRDSRGYFQAKRKFQRWQIPAAPVREDEASRFVNCLKCHDPFGGVKGLTHSLLRRRARDIRNAFWRDNDGSNIVTKRFAPLTLNSDQENWRAFHTQNFLIRFRFNCVLT